MSGAGARMSLVVAVVLAAIWMLVPTFLPKDSRARIEAAAERAADPELPAPSTPDPWWVKALPSRFVTLGLDLRGGIDLKKRARVRTSHLL